MITSKFSIEIKLQSNQIEIAKNFRYLGVIMEIYVYQVVYAGQTSESQTKRAEVYERARPPFISDTKANNEAPLIVAVVYSDIILKDRP
jgi:hypothetical protein